MGEHEHAACLTLVLSRKIPHNPMVNAGAIVCTSLMHKGKDSSEEKISSYLDVCQRLSADKTVSCDTAVFLSERGTADRNFALAYSMRVCVCACIHILALP
jgi:glutaminase